VCVNEAQWVIGDARVAVAEGAPALRGIADRLLTMLTRQSKSRGKRAPG
jgi:hypothetical protein